MLGEIKKIYCFNNKIYICSNNAIYIFNSQGKFLSVLDKKGIGPNEYIHIDDFQVLDNGNILILSRSDKKIFEYDGVSNCINSIELDFWALNFYADGNNIYVYLGNEISGEKNYKIVKYNNGSYSNGYIEIDKNKAKYLHIFSTNNFTKHSGTLYFYESFSDYVYQFENEIFKNKLIINFGSKNIPVDFYSQNFSNIMEFFKVLKNKDYAYGIQLFTETENNYFISYLYKQKTHFSINNKITNSTNDFVKIIENTQLYDFPIECDIDKSFIQNNLLMTTIDNQLITDYMDSLKNKDAKEVISKKISKDAEANPILVIFSLK